jgi:hypothetical protein
MGALRFGDVHEPMNRDECPECNASNAIVCPHWKLKPSWRIWLAWFLRMLGWTGDPS